MAAPYVIFGAKVPAHYLSIGTILAVVGGITLPKYLSPATVTPAASPAPVAAAPAEELDVEKAINDFLSSDEKK